MTANAGATVAVTLIYYATRVATISSSATRATKNKREVDVLAVTVPLEEFVAGRRQQQALGEIAVKRCGERAPCPSAVCLPLSSSVRVLVRCTSGIGFIKDFKTRHTKESSSAWTHRLHGTCRRKRFAVPSVPARSGQCARGVIIIHCVESSSS